MYLEGKVPSMVLYTLLRRPFNEESRTQCLERNRKMTLCKFTINSRFSSYVTELLVCRSCKCFATADRHAN